MFDDDDNDEERICLKECHSAINSAVLQNDKKLARIEKCRDDNRLFEVLVTFSFTEFAG